MKRLGLLVFELVLVAAAMLAGHAIYLDINFIPSFVFDYQSGHLSRDELLLMLGAFLGVHLVFLGASKLTADWQALSSPPAFGREVYLLVVSVSVTSLIVFVFTTIFFDPNFFAASAVCIAVLFAAAYLGCAFATAPAGRRLPALPAQLGGALSAVFRRLFTLTGVIAVLIAMSPVITAVEFKRNKDFANKINAVRLYFNSEELEWVLVDAFPGVSFARPMQVLFAARDPHTPYVLERDGLIYRMRRDGGWSKDLVLDFQRRVGEVDIENGALGAALHPEFGVADAPGAGYLYVYYTEFREGRQVNRLSRFDVSLPSLDERAASETVLMELGRRLTGFHNGGTARFGPDGFLYLGTGDALDQETYQTLGRGLWGGILRIDVDELGGTVSHPIRRQPYAGSTANYMIPADNPFAGREGVLEEFWALGLRNPFRFSFDPETGLLWAGDVGGGLFEEVNVVTKGGNYQWPYMEGHQRFEAAPEEPIGEERSPFYAYRHTAFERAIIGGAVYRHERHPELRGLYLFADNGAGHVYAIPTDLDDESPRRTALAKIDFFGYVGISSVSVAPAGDVLVTTLGSKAAATGRITKLVKASSEEAGRAAAVAPEAGPQDVVFSDTIQSVFVESCARCHGREGEGEPELGRQLGVDLPDFSSPDWQASRTDLQLREAISKGGGAVGLNAAMPAWGEVLSEEQIEEMVALIRSMKAD